MATPDVRVRLSAEGTAEVVAALKKVQAESAASAGKSAGAFKGFNSVLASTKALLASLGVGIGIAAVTTLAKRVADFAGNMREAGQRVGTTTERISALAHAARNAGSSLEQLEAASGVLNKNIAEGSDKFVQALGAIGLAVEDFQGLDTAQRIGLIAEKFATLKTSGEKTALAFAIFGKQGKALIPLLNEMAGGLDATVESARRLGVIISDDTARSLDEMSDSLETIKTQAIVIAAQFLQGLAPDIKDALAEISEAMAKSAADGENWGQEFGKVLRFLGTGFAALGVAIGGTIKIQKAWLDTLREFAENPTEAKAIFNNFLTTLEETKKDFDDAILRLSEIQVGPIQGPELPPLTPTLVDVGDFGGEGAAAAAVNVETLRAKLAAVNEELITLGAVNIATPIGENIEELRESLRAAEDQLKKLKEATENFERRRVAGTISSVDVEAATQGVDNLIESAEEIGPAFNDAQRDIDQFALDTRRASEEAAIALEQVKQREEQVAFAALDLAQSGLAGFFEEGTESLDGFARALKRFAAELLAAQVIAAASRIFTLGGGGGGGGFTLPAGLPAASGGGLVTGPGTGTSDSIPARLSAGEFVVRSAIVAQPGVLEGLAALNRGMRVPALARAHGVSSFAEGGLVGGAGNGGSASLDSSLTVGLEKGLVLRELQSPEGQRLIIKTLAENSRTVGRLAG